MNKMEDKTEYFKIMTGDQVCKAAKKEWADFLRNADWQIDKDCNLTYKGYYTIDRDRLDKNDWILHLRGKHWIDFNEFIPIYFEALERAGIKELTIIPFYTNKINQ